MSILRETFPPIAERVFYFYWTPYARAFSHRSFFSHAPIIGTLLRLAYAFWFLIPLLDLRVFAWAITAIISADLLHWVMDWKAWGAVGMFRQ